MHAREHVVAHCIPSHGATTLGSVRLTNLSSRDVVIGSSARMTSPRLPESANSSTKRKLANLFRRRLLNNKQESPSKRIKLRLSPSHIVGDRHGDSPAHHATYHDSPGFSMPISPLNSANSYAQQHSLRVSTASAVKTPRTNGSQNSRAFRSSAGGPPKPSGSWFSSTFQHRSSVDEGRT